MLVAYTVYIYIYTIDTFLIKYSRKQPRIVFRNCDKAFMGLPKSLVFRLLSTLFSCYCFDYKGPFSARKSVAVSSKSSIRNDHMRRNHFFSSPHSLRPLSKSSSSARFGIVVPHLPSCYTVYCCYSGLL